MLYCNLIFKTSSILRYDAILEIEKKILGKRKEEKGEWKMENGEWRKGNGNWRKKNGNGNDEWKQVKNID